MTATFNPTSNLSLNSVYTATITTGAKDVAGNSLAVDYVWSFTTEVTVDITAPIVTSTVPINNAINASLNGNITATFNEAIDPLTITTATMTLRQGANSVSGTVDYSGVTASFNPTNNLAASTVYTATLTTGVRDLAGNALANNYVWSFTSGTIPDDSPPVVTAMAPINGSNDAPLNGNINATFSEALDPLSISATTMMMRQGTTSIPGTVHYSGVTASFDPASALSPSTAYSVTITTGVRDLAGNAMSNNYVWAFSTGSTPDLTSPIVISTIPIDGAVGALIGGNLAATFSESMNPLTITASTFTLRQGATAISGTVSYTGVTANFNPTNNLASNTAYTATISPDVQDLAGNSMGENYVWSFTTGSATDIVAPTVILTVPANHAVGVLIGSNLSATFSEAMNPLTITTSNFVLRLGTSVVAGSVFYSGVTALFNPAVNLSASTEYTATITDNVRDLAGNAMAHSYIWSFTTGTTPDITPPTIVATIPFDHATGVSLNGNVSANFSEAMNPLSITRFTMTLRQGATSISGTVNYAGQSSTFNPSSQLTAVTEYTATVTSGVRDLAGNAMDNNYVWTFTTGASPDLTPPTVLSTIPDCNATGVAVNALITAAFSEAMDPLTVNSGTFSLRAPDETPIFGVVSYSVFSHELTFEPNGDLEPSTNYTFRISDDAEDVAGNRLADEFVCSFTTGQAFLESIDLGAASEYGVLAGSTVTNTALTTINGDLGVSPGTAVTGFPPGVVNGSMHEGDAAAAQAKLDLTTAYNDAAGRTTAPITISGNIGGQTLAPGLYKSNTSLEITSGDLTLDAQGDGNAIWIFQIASTLTTTSGRQVILSGGARAGNIYWQVGSSATLGTNSVFKGNILADQSITLTTGATLDGRALTRIAAVSLDSNTITVPAVGAFVSNYSAR
ncbi:MAG: Ig-like domain-containing protein [bacterium]|nr:Ig-like domain-containing protein [bacterium]